PAVRVRGALDVLLLSEMDVRRVLVDQLPEGYQMYRKQVLFAPHAADNQIPDLIKARDAQGRFLKMIADVRHGFEGSDPRHAFHFYDEPTEFLFIEDGSISHAVYSFDMPLN